MLRPVLFAVFFSLLALPVMAGKARLVAGPMQGHTTAWATNVWLMVKNTAKVNVTLINTVNNASVSIAQNTADGRSYKGMTPLNFNFVALAPDQQYKVQVILDGDTVKMDRTVRTFHNDPDKPYSFLIASCAYLPPVGFRWMQPGIEERIFPRMTATQSDFMIWTGDYLYFWKWHYKSWEGMMRKYIHTRTQKKMQAFMESRPQYAIWDDHDYGPNDADAHWGGEANAYDLFKRFWANPSYGTDSFGGIYTSFKYSDSEFFLTDDRSFRTEPGVKDPTLLGKAQINLLKEQLKASDATFKFIVTGSQVLNKMNTKECYQKYIDEITDLTDYIYNNHITGVIFLTGDMHYSELVKTDREKGYPLYDFTCSAVTSFPYKVTRHGQKENPQRIGDKIYEKQNYGRVSISGEKGSKVCLIEVFNNRGKVVWSHSIPEKELQFAQVSEPGIIVPVKNN